MMSSTRTSPPEGIVSAASVSAPAVVSTSGRGPPPPEQPEEGVDMARRKRGVRNRLIHSDRLERSVTQANGAVGVVKSLWEPAEKMRARAEILQTWHDLAMRDPEELDDGFLPTLPDKAPSDVRKVSETSITPNAKSLIDQFSQQLRIEGIRLADAAENAPAWEIFERNGMGGKQVPLWKSQFLHGQAFAVALPAVGRLDGKKTAAFQLKSARRM